MTAPEYGVEIIPVDLHKAWQLPEASVEIWEEAVPGFPGWSFYRLPDGKAAAISESISADWTQAFALSALCRTIANVTQVCPACGAHPSLGSRGRFVAGREVDAVMEHDPVCPVSDDGMREAAQHGDPVPPMPELPRYWVVWAPRLRQGYRPRRRFTP